MEEKKERKEISLREVAHILFARRTTFMKVWLTVGILSVVWILPQPRYYKSSVSLAPEEAGSNLGGVASLASTMGINLGGGNDAIYPQLYPELFESPEFLVGLFPITVTTSDGSCRNMAYATYMREHQQKNWLLYPMKQGVKAFASLFVRKKKQQQAATARPNPFRLSEADYDLMNIIRRKVSCAVDQRTDVITISVKDQDPLVSALLTDSVRTHLQEYIIRYRTSKARLDVEHYEDLVKRSRKEYEKAVARYSRFCDANQEVVLQTYISQRDQLENEMQIKYNTYAATQTQLEATKAKLQEKTPSFTVLKSATVPHNAAGPKRMLFVLSMLLLATFVTVMVVLRRFLTQQLRVYGKAKKE